MKEFDIFKAHVYNSLGIGHRNAKGRRRLCRELKCSDRVLRKAIEGLRLNYPILNRGDKKGYYLPETTEEGRDEARKWVRQQMRRIMSIWVATTGARKFCEYSKPRRRLRKPRRPRKETPGQISMFGAGRYL